MTSPGGDLGAPEMTMHLVVSREPSISIGEVEADMRLQLYVAPRRHDQKNRLGTQ